MKEEFCPFQEAKDSACAVDVVLMQYNYLLSGMIRRTLKIDFTNTIIICDEGHNVPGVCENLVSWKVSVSELDQMGDIIANINKLNPIQKLKISETGPIVIVEAK